MLTTSPVQPAFPGRWQSQTQGREMMFQAGAYSLGPPVVLHLWAL